ncbi:MAG TPA: putative Ig domain-containing protein [Thermoanaerobaculia bacterium]|jgi:hypothetical protein|nr:putative Ig domain-containing protein [Thermoanaerobaculia bacterium]
MRKTAFLALALFFIAAAAMPDCSTLTNVTEAIPEMTLGEHVNFQIEMVGGTPPYSFTITDGSLPSGLHLTSGGRLHGVPHELADVTILVKITDAEGCTLSIAYPVRVNP